MFIPYQSYAVQTPLNTVALDANVAALVNAINTGTVIPYGDYGKDILYYFSVLNNGLGNIIYTSFDRATTMGLSTFMVRYGAATTVRDIIFGQMPKSVIDLKYIILPKIPLQTQINGTVIPQ